VTDAVTGWPLYARLDIAGYPGGPVFTNPLTGAYSVTLIASTYSFTPTALSGGYTVASTPVVVAGDMTQNFALNALAACTAPGYAPGSTIFSDGFEGTFPPAGWNRYETGGDPSPLFLQGTTGTAGSNGSPHSGTYHAWHNDDYATGTNIVSWLVTSQISVPAGGGSFSFWQRGYFGAWYIYHSVLVTTGASPDPGVSTYTELWNGNTAETWSQQIIDLSAYAGQNVYLAFQYQGDFSDEWYLDDVAVQQPCAPIPSSGLVVGSVFDANTSLLAPNASVQSGSTNAVMIDASADPATPAQVYVIGLASGSRSITASAPAYGGDTDSVNVVAGSTIGHNFDLPTGLLTAAPASLTFNVMMNGTANQPAQLNNTGGLPATFQIFALGGVPSAPVVTGPFDPSTRHTGPKNLNDRDAAKLRIPPENPGIPPLAAGDVSASFNTTLTFGWGIGFNTTANDLWVGNIAAGGGDDKNYRFTTAGVKTTDTIDVAGMGGGVFAADMAYNPSTNKLWQVNVGGDNCIYELDPVAKTVTGNKVCPAFGTSERGLAYDPISDTFYAGSWNDGKINHFAPDGTLLSSVNVNLSISGLAYNPVSKHLFVLSNTNSASNPANYDITVLDAANNYAVVGGFHLMQGATHVFANNAQAGLEIDCSGNLWAVDQAAQKVYVAASGETGVCNWQADWLSATPASGSVPASGNTPLTVNVSAVGKGFGTYQGYLRIANSTPYGAKFLPVTMNVIAGAIPDPWVGGISIQSDQSIVAVARPHLGSQIASYIGSGAGSTTQYVPMLFKDAFSGGSYKSALYIQNLGGASASLTIEFIDASGVAVHTINEPLAAKASKGYWLSGIAGIPSGFAGGAKVTADQPVLAVGRPHIGAEVMTYNGMAAGSTTAWLPMFFKNGFGSYNTALYVQNVTANSADLTIEYLNLDGTVACTYADTLGANASKGYWSLSVTCDTGALPSGFVGGVKVTSTQNILAVGRAHLGTQITTYNGFSSGATTAYVPMLFRNAFAGGSYKAALYLQNVSGSSADVTIEYVDNNGVVAASQTVPLAAGAISSIWLPTVAGLPDGFVGGARITATQAIVAIGRPHLGTEITAYNGTSAGSLNAYLPMLFKNAFAAPYNAAFYIQNVTNSAATVDISFYDDAGVLSCIKTINLAAFATQGFWMPTVTCAP
jgi:hypothetical protein